MRQRTISDSFWRDPEISDLSQEDKATLLYFLTSPSSNIVGCYQVVFRIAAAEMGWTQDQMLVVTKRLKARELIEFNDDGWIWVKIWWKHNSAKGTFSPKLIEIAKKQCLSVPSGWVNEFFDWLKIVGVDTLWIGYPYPTDTPSIPYRYPVDTLSIGYPQNAKISSNPVNTGIDTPSIPYGYPIGRVPHTPPPNIQLTTYNIQNTTTTTTPGDSGNEASQTHPQKAVVVIDLIFSPNLSDAQKTTIAEMLSESALPVQQQQVLLDELQGAQFTRDIPNPIGYVRALIERAKSNTFKPELAVAVAHRRTQQATTANHLANLDRQSHEQQGDLLQKLPPNLRDKLARMHPGR